MPHCSAHSSSSSSSSLYLQYSDFFPKTLHIPILKRLMLLSAFYFILHFVVTPLFHKNKAQECIEMLSWLVISRPSFVPLHGLAYILLPQISSLIACPRHIHQNMAALFLETCIYYTLIQMLILHIVYTLYSQQTAWMTSLYFGVYFIHFVQTFVETYPRCTLSSSNLSLSMYSYIFGTILLSFYSFSASSSSFAQGNHHFEAWTLAELAAYMNTFLWRQSSLYVYKQ